MLSATSAYADWLWILTTESFRPREAMHQVGEAIGILPRGVLVFESKELIANLIG